MRRLPCLYVILALLGDVAPAAGGDLPAPTGEVVLRVSGQIARANDDRGALFDLASLLSLPAARLVTSTAWTEEPVSFSGVLLRDLLAAVAAKGRVLHATAINDYAVDIPVDDAASYDVLVAYRMNGRAMSVRDKGPLWIIYPVDQHPELAGPDTEAKMIWQLRELAVQ